jgi:hypothetical protein
LVDDCLPPDSNTASASAYTGKDTSRLKETPSPLATPVAAVVGSFCERTGVTWKIQTGIQEWASQLEREPRYADLDLVYEIRNCAEWHESKKTKVKSADRTIRNWLELAADRAKARNGAGHVKRRAEDALVMSAAEVRERDG